MMALTHVAVGTLAFAGLATLFSSDVSGAALGAAALGSLLPDVDTPSSRAGFCVYPLALWLERKFGHRTVTHSVTGIAVCALVFSPLLFFPWGHALFIALVSGFAFHLAGDACTKAGVPMMWPRRERWVFPGDAKFRLTTGSRAEWVVLGLVVALSALTLPVARMGPRRWLHVVRADLGSAVRDQQDYAGRFATEAEIEGYDVLTHKVVSGRFPIAGLQGDDGLLIEREGALWMVSKSATSADPFRIEPRKVRVYAVRPLQIKQVTLPVSNMTLMGLVNRTLDGTSALPHESKVAWNDHFKMEDIRFSGVEHCFPFGKGQRAPKDRPATPGIKTVEVSGSDVLTLRNASLPDLQACGEVAIRFAQLSLTLPRTLPVPRLLFVGGSRTVEVPHLGRHADLLVEAGQILRRGTALGKPFAQTLKPQISPEDQLRDAAAKAAGKQLAGLDAEEAAMRKSELWAQLASSFAQRRAALKKAALYRATETKPEKAPAPVLCPVPGVVEAIEWEAPTIPMLPGEKPEHTARVTLVEVTNT